MRALLLRFFKFVRFGWKLLLFWFLSIVAFGTWAAINAWLAPDVPNNRHFDGAFYHFVIGGFAGFYIGPCLFVLYHALGFVVDNCLDGRCMASPLRIPNLIRR
jgi:hypothetical protein